MEYKCVWQTEDFSGTGYKIKVMRPVRPEGENEQSITCRIKKLADIIDNCGVLKGSTPDICGANNSPAKDKPLSAGQP